MSATRQDTENTWLSNISTPDKVQNPTETKSHDGICQADKVEENEFETEAEEDIRLGWRPELKEPENINQAKANLKLQDDDAVVRLTRSNSTSTEFFTHVQHLYIGRDFRPLRGFHEAGLAKDLMNLKSLLLDIREVSEQDKALFREPLLDLFRNMQSLQSLVIRAEEFQYTLPIATICRTGSTIQSLELEGESRSSGRDPVLVSDLKALLQYFPIMENLKIYLPMFPYKGIAGYMDRLTFEAQEFLETLVQFRELKTVHLQAQHNLSPPNPAGTVKPEDDGPNFPEMRDIMRTLVRTKVGKCFEEVKIKSGKRCLPKYWRFEYKNGSLSAEFGDPRDGWPRTRVFRFLSDPYSIDTTGESLPFDAHLSPRLRLRKGIWSRLETARIDSTEIKPGHTV